MQEFNICVIPDKKTQELCINLSQELGQKDKTLFTLNKINTIPHISQYHIGVPDKNVKILFKLIQEIAQNYSPFQVKSRGTSQLNGYFCIDIVKSTILRKMQNDIIHSLNPLREGTLREGMRSHLKEKNLNLQRLKYIENTGYYFTKKEFYPHLTITKYAQEKQAKQIVKQLIAPKISFNASAISIGKIGFHGTLPQIFSSYRLK